MDNADLVVRIEELAADRRRSPIQEVKRRFLICQFCSDPTKNGDEYCSEDCMIDGENVKKMKKIGVL